jgi:hypothetical protein
VLEARKHLIVFDYRAHISRYHLEWKVAKINHPDLWCLAGVMILFNGHYRDKVFRCEAGVVI